MGSVTVTILIDVIGRNCFAPGSTALELDVLDVDPGIDNIDIDTFTTIRVIDILCKSAETKLSSVTDTRKALIWITVSLAVQVDIIC
jgi:hypothetical protein